MSRLNLIRRLNELLLLEMEECRDQAIKFAQDEVAQRNLLRSLMNMRSPMPLGAEFIKLQDELLNRELMEKGPVDPFSLSTISDERIVLWQGDITRLAADAIVNAANSELLGCFHPRHGCIDNAIHSAAGLQLRDECAAIMAKQGYPEAAGTVKVTNAYNLPSRFVFHTVGPIVAGSLTRQDRETLRSCYDSCLTVAAEMRLSSIAFCCISTGEYHFPPEEAACIAIGTVRDFLSRDSSVVRVVFNVFKDSDREIYERLLAR
jgi:O-acetyl-ADP-ribose deacetylase (regulator of RNase III)